jgi:hypothetical protein
MQIRRHHSFSIVAAVALTLFVAAVPLATQAQVAPCVSVAISSPPPPLPVYTQPPPPAPNYAWNPGYWSWGPYGYYWVPGVWAPPPAVGLYWTPGYWAFVGGGYVWNAGYWGASVGFYGGINYGFGYFGVGYVGGSWVGNTFAYNTAVTNVNTTIVRNTYFNKTVINRNVINGSRVSFNGGRGGTSARPTSGQLAAARARRAGPTALQMKQARAAGLNRNNLAAFNHGRPPVTAVRRPTTSVSRQPDFRPLSATDKQVARGQALSHMRLAAAPMTTGKSGHLQSKTAAQHQEQRSSSLSPSRSQARTAHAPMTQSKSESARNRAGDAGAVRGGMRGSTGSPRFEGRQAYPGRSYYGGGHYGGSAHYGGGTHYGGGGHYGGGQPGHAQSGHGPPRGS